VPKIKLPTLARALWIAITVGFLLSFLSVVAAIVLAINDPSLEVPLVAHFVVWGCGTAIALLVMLRRRQKSKGPTTN
jgi:hypothetical protein